MTDVEAVDELIWLQMKIEESEKDWERNALTARFREVVGKHCKSSDTFKYTSTILACDANSDQYL